MCRGRDTPPDHDTREIYCCRCAIKGEGEADIQISFRAKVAVVKSLVYTAVASDRPRTENTTLHTTDSDRVQQSGSKEGTGIAGAFANDGCQSDLKSNNTSTEQQQ